MKPSNKANENNILVSFIMKNPQEIADFLDMRNDTVFQQELQKIQLKLLDLVEENM